MTSNDQINEIVTATLKEYNFENTPTNRLQVLTSMHDAWIKTRFDDSVDDVNLVINLHLLLAITKEIIQLQITLDISLN